MAYANKDIDHEKRKNQEGSYSVYNYMYRYLMNNYESGQDIDKHALIDVGKTYCIRGGNKINDQELKQYAEQAIENFNSNNGKHGDTARNFGKQQDNTFETVKKSLSDLRW